MAAWLGFHSVKVLGALPLSSRGSKQQVQPQQQSRAPPVPIPNPGTRSRPPHLASMPCKTPLQTASKGQTARETPLKMNPFHLPSTTKSLLQRSVPPSPARMEARIRRARWQRAGAWQHRLPLAGCPALGRARHLNGLKKNRSTKRRTEHHKGGLTSGSWEVKGSGPGEGKLCLKNDNFCLGNARAVKGALLQGSPGAREQNKKSL